MMTPIKIANCSIGPGYPVYLVAELSANHNGCLERALELIRAARAAGADAVKLQTYTADTLTLDSSGDLFTIRGGTPWDGRTLHALYREAATPWEWYPHLAAEAAAQGLSLFSSPFDATAVDFLETQGAPAYKVASFELVDLPLIRRIAATGKPMILSTGMATFEEIEEAVITARTAGARDLILLKCTSAYPAPPAEMHLRTLPHLAATFGVPVGLSDHTLGITIPIAAVALGACLIEKHLTLSRAEGGVDAAFSLEPGEFRAMAEAVRTAEQALGEVQYTLTAAEERNRVFRRSLFVVRELRCGEPFTLDNVRSIRPGYGLHTRYLNKILNCPATRDIPRGTPLDWSLVGNRDLFRPIARVVGVIQARLGSTRLPRKVLADLQGQPMIGRILERVALAKRVHATVIATTTDPSDDALVEYAQHAGVGCHRGPVDDLATRLYGAAQAFEADVIVRVWGDCPCVDPAIIDEALEHLLTEDLDYISNSIAAGRTYPYGLDFEIYRTTLLERLCATTIDPFYREFPFEWVMAHRAKLRMGILRLAEDWSHIHLTVDYHEDLALVREVYQALYQSGSAFGWRQAVDWLVQQPELTRDVANLTRNPEYHQKSAEHQHRQDAT
ncbi:N-acetylneuraminate synthase [Gammaproteobacteria bacterium]